MSDAIDIAFEAACVPVDVRASDTAGLSSFEDFYAEHGRRIALALELTLGDRALAEDALTEAMTKALMRWKQVGGYVNPSGWVYRVGLNWARSWLRRRRRERDRLPHATDSAGEPVVEPRLRDALARLTSEHREVVVGRLLLDWSTEETADALDIAEGTVKSRLSRALDQLREDLGVGEEDT